MTKPTHPVIERMAEAIVSAFVAHAPGEVSKVGPAMAQAALRSLLEDLPDDVVEAAWTQTAAVTPEQRMALELCDNKAAFKFKARDRFQAMIRKILGDQP